MKNGWLFPDSSGGEFDGFKDAGIEYFAGTPYSSLAREVIQNSLDARMKDDHPVRVYFELVDVPRNEFPDLAGLEDAVTRALAQAKELGESEATEFFEGAKLILAQTKILCLRMADTNTVGLKGPCSLGEPYFAFMKAKGQSIKASPTAGGSFGIGKNAPFALSDLRTIFVSTKYKKGSAWVELAQGKSILMSHDSRRGKKTRGAGYFGNPGACGPIEPESAIPAWLRRDSQFEGDVASVRGTTVFVAGFRQRKNWQGLLLASVITNYFSAIHDGELEVFIDDGEFRYELSTDTLDEWFKHEDVQSVAGAEDIEDGLELVADMSRCLFDKGAIEETAQLPRLGLCRMRLLVAEGLPRRVGILRNGMLITHRLRRLVQFPGFSDFVAVVDCLNPKGRQRLRSMENPEHNDFEPERLRNQDEIRKAREELGYLADFVKRTLKKHATIERGEVTALDELAEFFQDPDEESPVPQYEGGETDLEGSLVVLAKPPRVSRSRASALVEVDDGDDGGGGGGGGGHGGGGGGKGLGKGTGKGGSGASSQGRTILLEDLRCVVVNDVERDIYFTPTTSGVADLAVEDSGADMTYALKVVSVKGGGSIKAGKIAGIQLKAKDRKKLRIKLGDKFRGAIRVTANEV